MLGTHHDQQRRTRAGSFDRFIPVRDSLGLAAASFKISGSPRRRGDGAATSPQDVFCEIVAQTGDASNIDSPSKTCRESPGDYRQRMSLLTEMDTEDNVLSFRPRQRSGSWSACVYGDPESTKLPCRQLQSSPVRTLDVAGVNGTNGDFSQLFDINRQGQLALPGGDAVHIHEITRSHLELQHYSLHIFKLEPNGPGDTRHHCRRYWCVQWSPRGGTLAVGGPDLMLIDVQLGDVTASITPPSLLSCLDWSRHCLSAGFLDGAVCAYDTRAGLNTVGCFTGSSRPSTSAVTALRYSTDGGLLACGTADGKLVIWDARQCAKPQHEMEAHTDGVGAIAWCPWRPWYITTGGKASDQTIRLWNVYTGMMNKNIMVGSEVTSLAWCEQSSELVSSHGNQSGEANIRVWKSPKMHLVGEMKRHEGPVWQVGLTPEGSKLVSVGSDEILCLWDFWNNGSSMSSHGVSSNSRRRAFTSPGKSPALTIASPLALGGIR